MYILLCFQCVLINHHQPVHNTGVCNVNRFSLPLTAILTDTTSMWTFFILLINLQFFLPRTLDLIDTLLQLITALYNTLTPVNTINSNTLLNGQRFMGNKRRLEITGPHFYDKQSVLYGALCLLGAFSLYLRDTICIPGLFMSA